MMNRIASTAFLGGAAVGFALLAGSIPAAQATPQAVHCHTVKGCAEGELHHGEHRAEDHLRHEGHHLEHGHLF